MLNAYYFDGEDIKAQFEEAGIPLSQSTEQLIQHLADYVKEQYNLPFAEFLEETELTLKDVKLAAQEDDFDFADYADVALEDFYFKHQRVYAATLAAIKVKGT